MANVVVRVVQIDLSRDVIEAIRSELSASSLPDGTVFIGKVHNQPERISLMWMLRDEPILLDVPKADLSEAGRAVVVARELLDRITERTDGNRPL